MNSIKDEVKATHFHSSKCLASLTKQINFFLALVKQTLIQIHCCVLVVKKNVWLFRVKSLKNKVRFKMSRHELGRNCWDG